MIISCMAGINLTAGAETTNAPVSYLDEDGKEQTCTDYIAVTEATEYLADGNWYVVNSVVTLTGNYGLEVDGDVNLILCDGAKLTVNESISCYEDGNFTIYAQSTGGNMGKLIATYGENYTYGIGNGAYKSNRIITINGGDIQATGADVGEAYASNARGIYNGDNPVIINGGKVTASGYDNGINAKSVTINGGEVVANSDRNGIQAADVITINGGEVIANSDRNGIVAKDVTINGGEVVANSNSSGGIQATDVTINGGEVIASSTETKAIGGILTVADGLTVFGGDSADPTTERTDYAETRWKYMTVKKIPPEPVSYLDATGAEQTCTDYIAIKEAIGELTDGNWYVVNSDVTITGGLYVAGDVNLILCDGAKLTVNKGICCYEDGDFTIYAQSTGENMGKLIATYSDEYAYGIGNSYGNRIITINGGDIQATGSPTDTYEPDTGIYNGDNPVIINGGKVTASGYDGGIEAESVTINGGEVIASSTEKMAIDGNLTVADGLTVFGGDSADPTTVRTNYATNRWNYMTVKAAKLYSVTLTGGANATPDPAAGVSQTNIYGDMATVVYTANSGYYFEEFADITVNGITATRIDAETVRVYGTPEDDVVFTVPDATATATFSSTVNVVWSETLVKPEKLTATLAGVDSYTLNAENSWSNTVTGLMQANNNWSIDCPVGYSFSSSTVDTVTTFTFTFIPMPSPESVTADSITLEEVTGYEYSKDNGETWQDSPTFTGLAPGTEYTFVQRPKGTAFKSRTNVFGIEAFYVKFNVVNGKWDDGTNAEKTVVLVRTTNEDLVLTLKSSDIPAVGSKPDNGYKAGSWDTVPTTEAEVSADKTFTYTYAEKTTPTITAVPTASAITYGQTLADSTFTGGLADVDGTFAWTTKTTAPAVADSNTTEYDVTFTPSDTGNYTTAACKVKLIVKKAEPTITTAPTASAIKYGQTLADSKLSGGAADVDGTFAWTTNTTAPAVADSNTTEYDVTFTPNDADNYTTAACKVKLTVGKAKPTITTAPTASAITYGKTLADSTLSGGSADVDGTFAWTTKTTAPAVADSNTTEYDVTFTPKDTDNYTTAACKVKLTVNKAEPTITTAPTASAIKYGKTLADSTLSGGSADVDGTFAWTTNTIAPAVADSNTTEYDVTFTPTDKDNYTTAACKVKLTVGKAEPTITTAPTASAIKYGKTLADSKLSGGSASVQGKFTWTTDTIIPAIADSNTTEYDVTFTPNDKDNYTTAACKVKLTVGKADQAAPAVTAVAETIKGKADGKITGVNATMEYRMDGEATYTAITGTEITGLAAGTYKVRYKETETQTASPDTDAVVNSGSKITVTFDTNGGSRIPETQEHTYREKAVKPADNPIKTGHTFRFWSLDGTAEYDFETELTANITLKAVYFVNLYTITFDTDGGSAIAPITQDYNTTVTAPDDPTKTGYTFQGWEPAIPETMPAVNITVWAKWTINQYTITFDTVGGSAIAPIKADYGTAVKAPAAPTKSGFVFGGWDKEIPAKMPAENITIKAIWNYPAGTIFADTIKPVSAPVTSDVSADEDKELSISGEQNEFAASELEWDSVPGATNYSLYVKVGKSYVMLEDLGDKTNADVIHGVNGKYYVSTGGNYNIYTYVERTGTFKKTGTLKASKIDSIVKLNNVTENFMVKCNASGNMSSDKNSYKVSVKIYYKPAPKATVKDGKVTIKWAKVEGATMYRVMKKTSSGYKLVTETEKNSVRISKVKSGKYTYAVQALVDGEWTKVYKSDLASVTVK